MSLAECHYTDSHYAGLLGVITMDVGMLIGVMLSVVTLSVVAPSRQHSHKQYSFETLYFKFFNPDVNFFFVVTETAKPIVGLVQGTLTEREGSVQLTSSLGWLVW